MAILPTKDAIVRFDENEDRLNTFINSTGTYSTNSGLPDVETLPSFIQRNSAALNLLTATNVKGAWAASTAYSVWDEVQYSGTWYRCVVAHTSTSSFDSSKWRLSQGVTTGQLSSSTGATMVGYGSSTVASFLDSLQLLDYAALRSYTGSATYVVITQNKISGLFAKDPSDTTSSDDNGTIIVDSLNRRWKRQFSSLKNPEWYGAKFDGTTEDTSAFTSSLSDNITIKGGTSVLSNLQLSAYGITGSGLRSKLLAKSGANSVIYAGYTGTPSLWTPKPISDLTIDGNSMASDGVTFTSSSNSELSGRWTLERCSITKCNRAVYKSSGNIGNRIRDFSLSSSNYGYYSVGQNSPLMHGGSDLLQGGEINSCSKAAIYIDSSQSGTGGTTIRDVVIEGNSGFGMYVKNWTDSYTPLTLDNVWFEANASSPTVNINGTNYVPKDLRLENVASCNIINGLVPSKLELINSRLSIKDSTINDGVNSVYSIDSNSVVTASNLTVDGGVHPYIIDSLIRAKRKSGSFAQIHYAPIRDYKQGVLAEKLQSLPYDSGGTFTFNGSTVVTGSSVNDGRIFGSCCEIVIPNGATLVQPAITITSNKWCVLTFDVKLVSGTMTGFTFGCISAVTLSANYERLVTTKWNTIGSVCQIDTGGYAGMYLNNATGFPVTLRLSAWQIVQFDSEQEAINFYNARSYYK